MFFHRSDAASGLLVSAEVFVLKAKKPVGFGAIEADLDRDRYSAIVAVDLELAALLDTESALAKGLGRLTGSIFAGNQPAMFAIGQLADPASWLTLSFNKSFLGMSARISIGFCLQISARPGPRGFGLMATVEAQGSLGIGKVQFYAAFGVLVGTWGNEASSSGVIAWAEVALRIKVFWVFSFGAMVKAIIEQLGPQEPNYRRIGLEVRIETPWWLPDVTFRVEKVRDTPAAGGDAGDLRSGRPAPRCANPGSPPRRWSSSRPSATRGRAHDLRSCVRCRWVSLPRTTGTRCTRSASTPCSPSTSPPRSATRPPSHRSAPVDAGVQAAGRAVARTSSPRRTP